MSSVRVPARGHYRQDPKTHITGIRGKYTALGYRSALVASREGRVYTSGAGDAHLQYDRDRLINQSRAFYRDNAIYKGMVDRAVSYIVGNGFTLQVKTNNQSFNAKLEGLWKRFWRRPEIRGVLSGADVSQTICRELILCGDTGAIKTNKSVLQLTEAEQLTAARFKDGIEKNIWGAPQRYWISPYDAQGYLATRGARNLTPSDFLFITCPDRPSSTRGVPVCQSAFAMLHRIDDICNAEAIAWQMLSRIAIAINRKDGPQQAYIESEEDSQATSDAPLTNRVTELDYALIFNGNEGDEITPIDRNIPGMNFGESLRSFLRILGLPLGLPLELILLDWTKSNYSQSRAVLEQAYQTFLNWQQKIEDFFYTEVFQWKLPQWRQSGEFGNRKDVDSIEYSWIKPTFPWLDQLKEAQACAAKVERGFMTHGGVCKSLNQDREEVVSIREKEIGDAIERAKRIEARTGEKVPWQHFAGLEVPGSAKPTTEPAKDDEDANADEKQNKDEDNA